MQILGAYIPMDRRQALVRDETLPDRAEGSALFADVSGFTPLAEALARQLGPQRGAEELARQLDQVYEALIAQVHRYGGSVIGFVGDAITCWFDGDQGLRTAACGLAMQQVMAPFAGVEVATEVVTTFTIKVGVASGPVRRFRVGDPRIQYLDVLAGDTLRQMSLAEGLAREGEVLLAPATGDRFKDAATVSEWRTHPGTGQHFAVVAELRISVPPAPWPAVPAEALTEVQVRPWVLPTLYERLRTGQSPFLAELRPAVALFLRFAGLDYDHDETAGAKLDAYIRWVQQVVTRYEGSLIQLTIGDKGSFLYAAFGALVAHDDDVVRAIRAAQELLEVPAGLDFIAGTQIGLAQGQVRAGPYGSTTRRSYGVIGDDAMLAIRLMAAAPPGEAWCAHSVYRQARGRIAFDSLPSVRVKGKAGLVRVYRPSGHPARGAVTRRSSLVTERSTLVGRQAEIAQLEAALDTVEAGETCMLLVEGEAGIGKSRLVSELARMVRERGLNGLLGAGHSIEQQTPYRAWRDVFSSYFDIDDVTDPAERQRQVETLVEHLAPDQLQRLPLLNDVLNLGLPDNELTAALDPDLRQQSLTLLLTRLLQIWTQERPLVVVLEDAHWLDSLSWGLATQVVRSLSVSVVPFLLVVVNRPLDEDSPGRRSLDQLQQMDICQAISLKALAPGDIVTLVADRLRVPVAELPPSVTELARTRSGGNPFFAEELVFALRDQGVIAMEEGHCHITGDLEQAQHTLPDTLHGLILARIDRLPLERQLVLKVAAVIGRAFAYTPLHHALNRYADILERALKDHLEKLEAADFTFLEALEPDLTYIFKHIITQEAAYQTLLYAQRRQLHRTVAEWYEETFGDEGLLPYYPLLVHHYHHAEARDKEQLYAQRAGDQAAAQFANAEAVRFFSRALELTSESNTAERFELLLAREKVYDVLAARDDQEADLAALVAVAAHLPVDRQARVALRQSRYARTIGNFPAAVVAAQQAIAQVQAVNVGLAAEGQIALGIALMRQGNYVDARACLEAAISALRQVQQHQQESDALRVLGVIFYYQGDYEAARDAYQRSLDMCRQIGDRSGEVKALSNLGLVWHDLGELEQALTTFQQTLAIDREMGDRRGESASLNNLGKAWYALGEIEQAKAVWQQTLTIRQEIGDPYGEAETLYNLGLTWQQLGEPIQAQEFFHRALESKRELGDTWGAGGTLLSLGRLWLDLGDLVSAEACFEQALAIHRDLDLPQMAVEDNAGLALVALTKGDLAQAQAYVTEILSYRESNPSFDGAFEPFRVFLACYRVLKAAQDPRATHILTGAHVLLQGRGAKIPDPALRRSFLENLAAHREILAAFQTMEA